MGFSIFDYWRMFRKHGIKLPYRYFKDAHYFDISKGTNTHYWRPKDLEIDTNWSKERFNGVIYMPSWTSEVKKSLNFLYSILGNNFGSFQFLDAGCGRGKPIFIYRDFIKKKKLLKTFSALGIDYSASNINIAKKNLTKISNKRDQRSIPNIEFINSEISNFQKYISCEKLIIYMYNPFGGDVLRNFVKQLTSYKCYVIYNNPENLDFFLEKDFELLYESYGWHVNCSTAILSNL